MFDNNGHSVYMEITNPIHGGEGWDFGEVLWSPGDSSWNIMKSVKAGDIIIHSLKRKTHVIVGASIVKDGAELVDYEPLKPGVWAGHKHYYRISIQNYSKFPKELKQIDFFQKYESQLINLGDQHSFYSLSEDRKKVNGTAQKYLASIPDKVQELLEDWFKNEGITDLFGNVQINDTSDHTVTSTGNPNPGKIKTTVTRTIRDTKMISQMKTQYDNKCQICGKKIILPNQKSYSEGHHLQKLGGVHGGPDIAENVIILCPYHHTEFDYGAIAIEPDTMKIIHIDKDNDYNGKALAYTRTDLKKEYLEYHLKNIYNK